MKRALAPIALAALLPACALSPERVATAGLAPGDVAAAGSFTRIGSSLTVAAGLREAEGRAVVCGTWSGGDYQARNYARTVLGAGVVRLDGRTLSQNLTYMLESPLPPGPGAAAGCTDTGLAWDPALAGRQLDIRLPAIIVEQDCDDFTCNVIRFRQTRPAMPI